MEPVRTDSAPPAGSDPPVPQGVRSGRFLFTSGLGPADPVTGRMPGDFAGQVRQALANVEAVVVAAGGSRRSIVRCACRLSDRAHHEEFDRVYGEFFAGCSPLPARTTMIAGPVRDHALVEVEAVAVIG
ncbi:RidA family protein [Streptomyces sp. NPDC003362]